jgi:hypothetical protein
MADLDTQVPGWKRDQAVPNGFVWKSSQPCQIDLTLTESTYHLKIQIAGYNLETSYPSSVKEPTKARNYFWANGDLLWQKELTPFVSGHPPSQYTPNHRDREDRIVGLFDDSSHLKMVTIQEWYVKKVGDQFISNWSAFDDDVLHGDYFICSVAPEIKFQQKPNTPRGWW